MELNKAGDSILLETAGEYAAVRGGFAAYVKLIEVKKRCNELHPSMNAEEVALLQEQAHAMPIHVSSRELPFAISGYHANIALKGLVRMRFYGSPEAHDFRDAQRQKLATLLGQE